MCSLRVVDMGGKNYGNLVHEILSPRRLLVLYAVLAPQLLSLAADPFLGLIIESVGPILTFLISLLK